MKIHKGFNRAEIAERYYRKLGKFTTRQQAAKNFDHLKYYDVDLIGQIMLEIYLEAFGRVVYQQKNIKKL